MLISREQTAKVIETCMSDKFVCSDCMLYAGIEVPCKPEARGTVARCYVCWNRKPCHSMQEWRGLDAA